MAGSIGRFTNRLKTGFGTPSPADVKVRQPSIGRNTGHVSLPEKGPLPGTPPPLSNKSKTGGMIPRKMADFSSISDLAKRGRDLLHLGKGKSSLPAKTAAFDDAANPERTEMGDELPPNYAHLSPERNPLQEGVVADPKLLHAPLRNTAPKATMFPPQAHAQAQAKMTAVIDELNHKLQVPSKNTSSKASMPPPPAYSASPSRVQGPAAPVRTSSVGNVGSRPPMQAPQGPGRSIFKNVHHMGDFLASDGAMESSIRKRVFNEGFQDRGQWASYMGKHLNGGSVTAQLSRPPNEWTHESFQAMFMTAWMSHPTEKGSYTIALTPEQSKHVQDAIAEHCDPRKSSHFSGKGFSASKGTTPFKGYGEMLIQHEMVEGKPVLFLKMEGHKTDLAGIVGHGKSWLNKVRTGEGVTASEDLKALANADPHLVEPRAAENYTNSYKSLLKDLGLQDKETLKGMGLKGKMVPAREMTAHLLAKTNFDFMHPDIKDLDLPNLPNDQVGHLLKRYVAAAGAPDGGLYRLNDGKKDRVTPETLKDIGRLADSLIADGDEHTGRVHREVTRSPAALDMARDKMMGPLAEPNAAGELIVPGNSLERKNAVRRDSRTAPSMEPQNASKPGELIMPGNSLGRSGAVRRDSRDAASPTPAYPSDNARPRRSST